MFLSRVLELVVIASTVASALVGLSTRRPRTGPARPTRPAIVRALAHPLAQFLLVCGLLYVNQVLFSAYVLRAHGGSPAFIARYIAGSGWFAISRTDPFVVFALRHVGNAEWLSPTVLRVQAFLELPFTMFAYLAVARLLGARLYAMLCRPAVLALAAVSFSVTFSLVEIWLANPYTNDDLVLRAVACVATPVYIAWISRRSSPEDEPRGLPGLLAFLAGAGAIAYVVLATYDAFLLYNLAHLSRHAGGLLLAVPVALAAAASPVLFRAVRAVRAVRGEAAKPSFAIALTSSSLRWFTFFFFVPSLAIRYGGNRPSAVLAGIACVVLGLVVGVATAVRSEKPAPRALARFAAAAFFAIVSGVASAAAVATHVPRGAIGELTLAASALAFLVVGVVVLRGAERLLSPHAV